MCAMQQLNASYVSKINPEQLKQLVKDGVIQQNGDKYYANSTLLSASCFVQEAGSVGGGQPIQKTGGVENPTVIKGAEIEHTAKQNPNIVSHESVTKFKIDDLMKQAGLDATKRDALIKAFTDAGISVDKDGNVSYAEQAKFDTAYAKFAKDNRMAIVTLAGDGSSEVQNDLVNDGTVVDQNGTLILKDKGKLDAALPNQTQAPVETREDVGIKLNAEVTTTTVEKSNHVDVPENLRGSKANRKQAEKDYRAVLEKWAEKPENQSAMNYSIARNQYDKQINKQMAKIKKETPTEEEIVKKYIDEYALPEEKAFLGKVLEEAKKDEKALLEVYRNVTGDYKATFDGATGAQKKEIAAYLRLAKDPAFDSDVLLERMAVVDVMNDRSEKQIKKDKEEFIKDEAERQVRAAETQQNLKNTKVYFSEVDSEKAAKAETNPAMMHNDIGDAGRKLVMECPDEFCTPGTAENHDFEVDGKYYKFSQDKFDAFCANITDSRNLDAESQENFGKDENLTLKEGRQGWMKQTLITKDGDRRSIDQIIGDNNGKVGNRELNKLRHMIEASGRSIDKNKTAGKRALHVLAHMGIGAALGFGTAAAGSWLAGAVEIAGMTKPQEIAYSGMTSPQDVNFSAKYNTTVKTTDFYHDEYGTISVTHDTPVSGEVNGTVTAPGQKYSGTVTADGQEYSGKKQHHMKTAGNAAIFGGLGGLASGLSTVGGVHAKGQNFDGIVNLNQEEKKVKTDNKQLTLKVPKFTTVEQRAVEKQEPPKEIPNYSYKIKVKRVNANTNEAEDRLSIVKKMYGIEDDATANKVLDYIMTKINGYKKNPYKTNYAANLTYHFPSEIPAGMIDGIDSDLTGQDPNKLSGYDMNRIVLGGSAGANASESALNKPGAKKKVNATITTR